MIDDLHILLREVVAYKINFTLLNLTLRIKLGENLYYNTYNTYMKKTYFKVIFASLALKYIYYFYLTDNKNFAKQVN